MIVYLWILLQNFFFHKSYEEILALQNVISVHSVSGKTDRRGGQHRRADGRDSANVGDHGRPPRVQQLQRRHRHYRRHELVVSAQTSPKN